MMLFFKVIYFALAHLCFFLGEIIKRKGSTNKENRLTDTASFWIAFLREIFVECVCFRL